MRFALMLESQQGLSYGDHVAIAKRAEANGLETLFRSDHFQSFPGPTGQPTTDAWTIMAGLARDTERIGLGVLVSPVTFRHPGDVRQGRHDRGRDERRPDRGRRRGGLERARASPARSRLPADRASGPTSWRTSWRSSTACGASRMAGRTTATRSRSATPTSTRSRSTSRADRGRRSVARGRGCSSVARDRRARTGWRRATRTSSTSARRTRRRPRPRSPRSTRPARPSAAIRRTLTRSTMAGVLIGRDQAEMDRRLAAAVGRVRGR